MLNRTQISIPNLVRVKPGAIGRVGIYARRHAFSEVAVLHSEDLHADLLKRLDEQVTSSLVGKCPELAHACADNSNAAAKFAFSCHNGLLHV